MKHIAIVAPCGQSNMSSVACIVGAFEILSDANLFWKKKGGRDSYKIEIVGISDRTEFSNGLVTIKPHADINTLQKTNLVVIPSLIRDYEQALEGNKLIVDWITRQYKQGAEIASMCTGAFMLAAAGLLNGKNCSTHWSAENTFRTLFPGVHLKTHSTITYEAGIYTNGGAYSFLNLLIYLIEKYYDRQTAIYCSKLFQIEIDRQYQSGFSIFSGQKLHDDEEIRRAQEYIESKISEKISIDEISSRLSIGRRNFDRRFIKATGNSPLEYAQRVKVEAAKKAFENSRKTIHEVMYEVGYSDLKAFREVFRKITGMSPLAYRSRYNKEIDVPRK
ncbi:helix-turn-helix domain-containing protein [Fulvivirgaceae bacterium PWU4]|uniref:Helix-turn-helix domain-containing protein n=1 Tax=Chryseosolibacter histidini TaxID=2782349 RepID=A0AAP2DL70_9BACT|nr:helix-turn-helix domain-containing protein [Chryseosolibacter histidini]MBT1698385.1 helix-turn-helix domain-containing protein [Chryseosolibacter histidini]